MHPETLNGKCDIFLSKPGWSHRIFNGQQLFHSSSPDWLLHMRRVLSHLIYWLRGHAIFNHTLSHRSTQVYVHKGTLYDWMTYCCALDNFDNEITFEVWAQTDGCKERLAEGRGLKQKSRNWKCQWTMGNREEAFYQLLQKEPLMAQCNQLKWPRHLEQERHI